MHSSYFRNTSSSRQRGSENADKYSRFQTHRWLESADVFELVYVEVGGLEEGVGFEFVIVFMSVLHLQ